MDVKKYRKRLSEFLKLTAMEIADNADEIISKVDSPLGNIVVTINIPITLDEPPGYSVEHEYYSKKVLDYIAEENKNWN